MSSSTSRLVAATAVALLGAMTGVVVGASPAAAAGEATPPPVQGITTFCAAASPGGFADTDGTTFEADIDCIASTEPAITVGGPGALPPSQYGPTLHVTRGQMASFIARMMDAADALDTGDAIEPLPPYDGTPAFTDIGLADSPENPHFTNINRLQQAGIVEGAPGGRLPTEYGPNDPVTRAQMASFIARAIEHMTGQPVATDQDYFTDDEGAVPHEDNINGIASLGIVQGIDTTGDLYAPARSVTRGQMAGFVARTLGELEERGAIAPLGASGGDGGGGGGGGAVPPTIVDARLRLDAGTADTVDSDDIVRLTFSEIVRNTGTRTGDPEAVALIDLVDADGDTFRVRCGWEGNATYLDVGDGVTDAACFFLDGEGQGRRVEATLLEVPEDRNPEAGADNGIQYPATITAVANVEDLSATPVSLPGSADLVVEDEGPTIDATELTTDAGGDGTVGVGDVATAEFSEEVRITAEGTFPANAPLMTLVDPNGDTIVVRCGLEGVTPGYATPADDVTDAACFFSGSTTANQGDTVTVTLAEDADDTNLGGDGTVVYPLRVSTMANVTDLTGNDVDLANSMDVIIEADPVVPV
jgi:hypothetical protein